MFDGRDMNKDGKLNKEEFMLHQKDPAQAAQNFVKFDKDKSGDVDRQEYVTSGK
jgi:Ca2+-binding EF-hand superfamily protein